CLFLLSLQAELVRHPGYMDSAYYYDVSANFAAGRGLVEDFVWNYLAGTPDLPAPAHRYWMPLTTLVAAPPLVLFEPSFRAAQLPFVLLGSLVPVFTLWLGWYLLRDARGALLAAGLTLFAGFYFGYWGALDSFSLFTLLTGGALVLMDRILGPRTPRGLVDAGVLRPGGPSRNGKTPHVHALPVSAPLRSYFRPAQLRAVSALGTAAPGLEELPPRAVLGHVPGAMVLGWIAGLLTGAAHLTRADGVLLLPVFGLLLINVKPRRWSVALAVGVTFSYLAIMGPWYLRGAGVSDTPPASLAARTVLLH
ncbi:MAG: hypothetical protein NTZ05_11900, partial [Chloroflexi bacterium]|nr:hypothetical protein [Chloroflexota bacterium]